MRLESLACRPQPGLHEARALTAATRGTRYRCSGIGYPAPMGFEHTSPPPFPRLSLRLTPVPSTCGFALPCPRCYAHATRSQPGLWQPLARDDRAATLPAAHTLEALVMFDAAYCTVTAGVRHFSRSAVPVHLARKPQPGRHDEMRKLVPEPD